MIWSVVMMIIVVLDEVTGVTDERMSGMYVEKKDGTLLRYHSTFSFV